MTDTRLRQLARDETLADEVAPRAAEREWQAHYLADWLVQHGR